MPTISVILPSVSEKNKIERFCTSLFSCSLDIELMICGNADIPEEFSDKIKLFSDGDELSAFNNALALARGKFIMISDASVTFADNALEKLIVASKGNSSACNVGAVLSGNCNKAFMQNFSFDELAAKPFFFNHLLSADIIRNNSLMSVGTDALSLMLFVADYYRYDVCSITEEVLMYVDSEPEYKTEFTLDLIEKYAAVFAATKNTIASMFFLRAVVTALLDNLNADTFDVLKSVVGLYSDDYAVSAWLKATFSVDTAILCDVNSSYSDFKNNGTGVFYKEVTLPVTADSVVRNFYFGKLGIDVLKKCIGAWGYYKFYRMKDGFIKNYGCKLFMKLLGGDFNA